MIKFATPRTERALRDANNERIKQINLGYTAEHDQEHGARSLARRAALYAGDGAHAIGGAENVRDNLLAAIGLLIAAVEVLDSGVTP